MFHRRPAIGMSGFAPRVFVFPNLIGALAPFMGQAVVQTGHAEAQGPIAIAERPIDLPNPVGCFIKVYTASRHDHEKNGQMLD
jgi:hypothetical protein